VYLGKQTYRTVVIGTADDHADADGVAVLNFTQAQALARSKHVEIVRRENDLPEDRGPYTVHTAITEYLAWMETHRKSGRGAKWQADAFILPKLGTVECSKLTARKLTKWLTEIAAEPPRLRSKRTATAPRHREVDLSNNEARRRRRSTANGVLMVLRAALNRAWRAEKIPSDDAWRRVKPFPETSAARPRYLTVPQCKALISKSEPDFRQLARAALFTGCRYSELGALVASDFNADSGTLEIRRSKSSKSRHVVVTDEGAKFFASLARGKARDALLLTRADGSPWTKSSQSRPMRAACIAAKIVPPIGFHGLRHTWASLTIMNRAPLLVVAQNLGHSDTRMVEKHYGHLAPSFIADTIRAAAPTFGKA
jgi:integrase